jgi:DnaJ-class molecular chaperone
MAVTADGGRSIETVANADYYAVLGVDRDADRDAVEVAAQQAVERWRQRTAAGSDIRRHDAELRLGLVRAAATTLLDDARKQAYDVLLFGGFKHAPSA